MILSCGVKPLAQEGMQDYLWYICQAIHELPDWRPPSMPTPCDAGYTVYVLKIGGRYTKVGHTGYVQRRLAQHQGKGLVFRVVARARFRTAHEAWAVEGILQRIMVYYGNKMHAFDWRADQYAKRAAPSIYKSHAPHDR